MSAAVRRHRLAAIVLVSLAHLRAVGIRSDAVPMLEASMLAAQQTSRGHGDHFEDAARGAVAGRPAAASMLAAEQTSEGFDDHLYVSLLFNKAVLDDLWTKEVPALLRAAEMQDIIKISKAARLEIVKIQEGARLSFTGAVIEATVKMIKFKVLLQSIDVVVGDMGESLQITGVDVRPMPGAMWQNYLHDKLGVVQSLLSWALPIKIPTMVCLPQKLTLRVPTVTSSPGKGDLGVGLAFSRANDYKRVIGAVPLYALEPNRANAQELQVGIYFSDNILSMLPKGMELPKWMQAAAAVFPWKVAVKVANLIAGQQKVQAGAAKLVSKQLARQQTTQAETLEKLSNRIQEIRYGNSNGWLDIFGVSLDKSKALLDLFNFTDVQSVVRDLAVCWRLKYHFFGGVGGKISAYQIADALQKGSMGANDKRMLSYILRNFVKQNWPVSDFIRKLGTQEFGERCNAARSAKALMDKSNDHVSSSNAKKGDLVIATQRARNHHGVGEVWTVGDERLTVTTDSIFISPMARLRTGDDVKVLRTFMADDAKRPAVLNEGRLGKVVKVAEGSISITLDDPPGPHQVKTPGEHQVKRQNYRNILHLVRLPVVGKACPN